MFALSQFFLEPAALEQLLEPAQRGADRLPVMDTHSQRHTYSHTPKWTRLLDFLAGRRRAPRKADPRGGRHFSGATGLRTVETANFPLPRGGRARLPKAPEAGGRKSPCGARPPGGGRGGASGVRLRSGPRKVMRPFVRSYGESATVTVSPGRMRMKCFRILPAMWAMISCPLSSFTRNCVLARACVTLPWTSIESSLAIHS